MNVFVFTRVTECTPYVCENVFGNADESQPRPKEDRRICCQDCCLSEMGSGCRILQA